MKNILNFIIGKIAENPKEIEIEEIQNENGILFLNIIAPQEQIGMLIGKSGRIIQAIRNTMKIVAVKNNLRINVGIREKEVVAQV